MQWSTWAWPITIFTVPHLFYTLAAWSQHGLEHKGLIKFQIPRRISGGQYNFRLPHCQGSGSHVT